MVKLVNKAIYQFYQFELQKIGKLVNRGLFTNFTNLEGKKSVKSVNQPFNYDRSKDRVGPNPYRGWRSFTLAIISTGVKIEWAQILNEAGKASPIR